MGDTVIHCGCPTPPAWDDEANTVLTARWLRRRSGDA